MEYDSDRAGLSWQTEIWNRMSDVYLREIDRRFVPVIEQVIARAGLSPGERALDIGAENRDGEVELVIRAEGPRILLDPALRETLGTGSYGGAVEPRAAGAWLPHSLAAEAGGSIRLSDPADDVLRIGATLPPQG